MPHVSSPTGSSIISSQPLVLKMSTNSSCLAKAQRAAESWCCCGSIPGWYLLQASGKTGKHKNLSCCCSFLSTGSIWGQLLAFGAVQSQLCAALGTAWGGPGAAGSCSWGGGIQGQEVQKCQGRGIGMEGKAVLPGSCRRALPLTGTAPGAGRGGAASRTEGIRVSLKKRLQDPNAHGQGSQILILGLVPC